VTDLPEIDIHTFAEQHAEGATVVDVREEDEYADGHVAGALHVPLATVPQRVAELPTDGSIFVICAVGGRSARAVQFLRNQGLDATNVAGGTMAWVESGRPVVTGLDPV
jgi:rhodanese-related sulfurtransferase